MRFNRTFGKIGLSILTVMTVAFITFVATLTVAHAAPPSLDVWVGYVDSTHGSPSQFPVPFGPGSGVTYDGCAPITSCQFDGGAVRLVNNTGGTVHLDYVTIDFGGCIFDLWSHNVDLANGDQLILVQTASGAGNGCTVGTNTSSQTMDSSDFGPSGAAWAGNCSQSGVIPQVTVSVGGTATTYKDTGQVLNTGGEDQADCHNIGPGTSENTQWQEIGSTPGCNGAMLTLTPASQSLIVDNPATVTAHLTNNCNQVLQGQAVDFAAVSGPNSGAIASANSSNPNAVTDANGDASLTYTGTTVGEDTLQASVKTALGDTFSSNQVTVDWSKLHTNLNLAPSSVSSDYHDAMNVSAQLTDDGGNGIANKQITFAMGTGTGTETCSASTDSGGTATCALTPFEAQGSYPLTATFAEDDQDLGSSAQGTFDVTLEETTTTITNNANVAVSGGSALLSANLIEDHDSNVPVSGRVLTLSLGSHSCTTPATDANGNASCVVNGLNNTTDLGPQTETAAFAGDNSTSNPNYYQASQATLNAIAYTGLASGSFVIGDNSAAASGSPTQTFWGAQWAKLNSLSAGAAPDAFKGFALNATNPTCGGTWSTDPGNSAPPPSGPLPSYMAVIVASTTSQSGSQISGNIAQIVIVKTNAGYAGDPGHAGTGTIVGQVC